MRASTRTVALFALPAIAHAVTLSDFAPRADQNTLTSACNSVYTADIPNCLPKDFQNPPCSASCVHGMVDIAQQVQSSCPNHKGDDVIAAFLAGGGPKRLCPNADDVLGASGGAQSSSQQQQPTSAQSTQAPSSTPTSTPQTTAASTVTASSATSVASSLEIDTTSTSAVSSASSTSSESTPSSSPTPTSSSTAAAATSASSSIVIDTSAAPSAIETSTSTSSAGSSEPTVTNDHSGGGSPFDTAGNLQSSASSASPHTLALVLAAAFAVLSLRP